MRPSINFETYVYRNRILLLVPIGHAWICNFKWCNCTWVFHWLAPFSGNIRPLILKMPVYLDDCILLDTKICYNWTSRDLFIYRIVIVSMYANALSIQTIVKRNEACPSRPRFGHNDSSTLMNSEVQDHFGVVIFNHSSSMNGFLGSSYQNHIKWSWKFKLSRIKSC